ncbi:signal transduction sensor histidine kinase [sediment metagenome]|uniref:Signal transduction sensor histidine kinase n=1 Tax=sediment metagenome TaxID=749907 RepID=D9PLD6_9ZZZZ
MSKVVPINEEYYFKEGLIVSSTDLKGIITYANRIFCDISGYSKEELVGSNHNIIRHPDMPRVAFKELWDTISVGRDWEGAVKNLRKDGRYYWVYTFITPIKNGNDIVGYSATRRPAKRDEIEKAIIQYSDLLGKELSESYTVKL